MQVIFIGVLIIIVILVVIFLSINLWINDLSLPGLNISDKKNILIIYPHPDDEVWMSGGLMNKLSKKSDVNLFVVSSTKGEHGDEILKLSPKELGEVRSHEYSNVMGILGVKNFELWDFVDGDSASEESRLKEKIQEFIKLHNIDLVITYERFGVYGHPDHVILSKVVRDVSSELKVDALYATLPDKILKRINLPKTLTYKDKVIELNPEGIADPEFKFNVTSSTLTRYKAIRQYKSQKFDDSMPLWLSITFSNYEYYTSKYE